MSPQLRYQEDDDPREGRMGFLEHLDELKTRIIRSGIAIGVAVALSAAWNQTMFARRWSACIF